MKKIICFIEIGAESALTVSQLERIQKFVDMECADLQIKVVDSGD